MIAEESAKIAEIRKKIEQRHSAIEAQTTTEKLAETTESIKKYIADNALHRAEVKVSCMGLFNCNRDPAPFSSKIDAIRAAHL